MRLENFQAVQLIFQHSRLEKNMLAHCSEFLAVVANEKCVAAKGNYGVFERPALSLYMYPKVVRIFQKLL